MNERAEPFSGLILALHLCVCVCVVNIMECVSGHPTGNSEHQRLKSWHSVEC